MFASDDGNQNVWHIRKGLQTTLVVVQNIHTISG